MGQVHADIMLLLLQQPDQGNSIHIILPDMAPEVSHLLWVDAKKTWQHLIYRYMKHLVHETRRRDAC